MIYRLYLELESLYPPIWRRVEVPASISLASLHRVIQACFAWSNTALYTFRTEREDYSVRHHEDMWQPDLAHTDVRDVTLAQVVEEDQRQLIQYRYGLGFTGWELLIRVEAKEPAHELSSLSAPLRLIGGQRAAPPEAFQGPLAYQALLAQWHNHAIDPMLLALLPPGFDPERCAVESLTLPAWETLQAQSSLDAGLDSAAFDLGALAGLGASLGFERAPLEPAPRAPAPQRRPFGWLEAQTQQLIEHARHGEIEPFVQLLMVELLHSELDMRDRRKLIERLASRYAPLPPPQAPAATPHDEAPLAPSPAPEAPALALEPAATEPLVTTEAALEASPPPALADSPLEVAADAAIDAPKDAHEEREDSEDSEDSEESVQLTPLESFELTSALDAALPALHDDLASSSFEPLEPLTSTPTTLEALPDMFEGQAALDELPALGEAPFDALEPLDEAPHTSLPALEALPELSFSALDEGLELPAHEPFVPESDELPELRSASTAGVVPHDEPALDMSAGQRLDDEPAPLSSAVAVASELEDLLSAPLVSDIYFEAFEPALSLPSMPKRLDVAQCLSGLENAQLNALLRTFELHQAHANAKRAAKERAVAGALASLEVLMALVDSLDAPARKLLEFLLEQPPSPVEAATFLASRQRLEPSIHPQWFDPSINSPLTTLRQLGLVYPARRADGAMCVVLPHELRQLLGVICA